jgi:hypothetical protein
MSKLYLESVIDALQEALEKCQTVNYNEDAKAEESAPYAIGWTTSTIKNALIDLNKLKQDLN